MFKQAARLAALAVLVGAHPVLAQATPRSAEEIVADYKAVVSPALDRSKTEDQKYVEGYLKERTAAELKRAELAKELFGVDPEHALVPVAMMARWQLLGRMPNRSAEVSAEVAGVLESGSPKGLVLPARQTKASMAMRAFQMGTGSFEAAQAAVEELIASAPTEAVAPSALAQLASVAKDPEVKKALNERLLKDYPDSKPAKFAKGEIRKAQGLGKPFEMSFTEAITGKPMSMGDFKGKVVVIDFWATWCGPCIAEMPKMKEMYAAWKDKGVEFIGVSLDQPEDKGGLKALKAYVEKEGIAWPQYYQGNYWDSEFSVSWGINSIPAVFVVDADGNLHSTEARGKLEELVPELLAKRDKAATPGK